MDIQNQINLINNDLITTVLYKNREIELLSNLESSFIISKKEDINSIEFKKFLTNSIKNTKEDYYLFLDVSSLDKLDLEFLNYFNETFKWDTYLKRILIVNHQQLNSNLDYLFLNTYVLLNSDSLDLDTL